MNVILILVFLIFFLSFFHVSKIVKMKRCEKNVEFLKQQREQQQKQLQKRQQYQEQAIDEQAEDQLCSFLQSTTPVWGDRMVSNRATPLRIELHLPTSFFLSAIRVVLYSFSLDSSPFIFNKMSAMEVVYRCCINRVFEVQT